MLRLTRCMCYVIRCMVTCMILYGETLLMHARFLDERERERHTHITWYMHGACYAINATCNLVCMMFLIMQIWIAIVSAHVMHHMPQHASHTP